MKKRAAMKLLAAPEDREYLQGILQQLRSKGVRVSDARGALGKNDIVLAALSERFYEDEELKSRLFAQLALGAENILPLNLGESPVPQEIMDLLFARNIITVAGRDETLVAERILSAIPERKNYMPVVFIAAAAVLLLLAGMFLWQSTLKPEPEPEILATEPVVYPFGITEEDLANIQNVVIMGDYFAYHTSEDIKHTAVWPEIYDFAYETWEADGRHWYSTEDGHEYTLTRYDDLRFLELMPNLRKLRMVLVDVEQDKLPDLSNSKYLNNVTLHDCKIDNVAWIAAKSVVTVDITNTAVTDYSPLTQCDSLYYAYIDGFGESGGDVSGFAPPGLQELYLSNLQSGEINLSALSGCTVLSRLHLDSLPIADLGFLEGMEKLEALIVDNMPALQDISALSTLPNLKELRIRRCETVTDYTPISSCGLLETLNIERDRWIPADSSFLNNLSNLHDIGLFGLNLNNMDFLATVNDRYGISLGFCGDIQDYSGLAERTRYRFLHVNPRSNGAPYGDYALVAPHLQNAIIEEMELYNCTNVGLADLPHIGNKLTITGGDLEELSGMNSEYLARLELRGMQYLRSLDGIEGLPKLSKGVVQLSLVGCPRLTDLDALHGKELFTLKLVDTYAMPDFSQVNVKTLCLESIEDMEDLRCLEALDKDRHYQFQFLGLDDLKDLSILREFHGGELFVPPQVADQAQELVAQGNFTSYEVRYPESGWNPLNEEIILLSLEELETLPKAVLRRVSRVWIAGDEVIDPNRHEIRSEWVGDGPVPVLYDRETGQTRRISLGTITDFEMLSGLTRIRELTLVHQPLANLEGIQYFTELTNFDASFCNNLTDASALFAQQGLRWICLSNTGIDSIQGVQNMPRLQGLSINWTQVSDLSPLADVDYSTAREWGGFHLDMQNCPVSDLSCLRAIPAFSYLGIYGRPAESWMGYVEQASIRAIGGEMGSDEGLKDFVRQHPELEEMYIEACHQLTDLTPLLELDGLRYVHIWDGTSPASYSLDGYERGFQLDID